MIPLSVLSLYLDRRKADIEWILRTRYCVKVEADEPEILTTSAYLSAPDEDKEKYYSGALGIEKLFDAIDPFEQAYDIESKSFDPTLSPEQIENYRARAEINALVVRREITKEDFFLHSIPVLPFVAELAKGSPEEFTKSKIATLTYRLWRRARRLSGFIESNKISRVILTNEARMIQEAADRLFAEYKISGIKFVKKRG